MKKVQLAVLVVLSLLGFMCEICHANINVTQCANAEKPFENLSERVTIGACKKPPCRLRKNTSVKIEMLLKPEKDVTSVKNGVWAYIVGVPFPFIGVDGTDACQQIFEADGKTKAGCPLKAGKDYVFRNSIEVLSIYPRVKTVVHWALVGDGKDLICFEVPARITN